MEMVDSVINWYPYQRSFGDLFFGYVVLLLSLYLLRLLTDIKFYSLFSMVSVLFYLLASLHVSVRMSGSLSGIYFLYLFCRVVIIYLMY